MGSVKPYIVIVPGVLHTPVLFGPLITALSARGYGAEAVQLSSVGEGAYTAQERDDVKSVRAVLEDRVLREERDVIVLCHSYGGIPGSQAIQGLDRQTRAKAQRKGGVLQIIFLAAFLLPDGSSVASLMVNFQVPPTWMAHDPNNAQILIGNDLVRDYLFEELNDEDAARWAKELRPIALNHATGATEGACWNLDIPKLYIRLGNDKALWPSVQNAMLEKVMDETWTVVEKPDWGHSPFLAHIEETADLLIENFRVSG